jgi:thiamine biosynthesis lipoprotein
MHLKDMFMNLVKNKLITCIAMIILSIAIIIIASNITLSKGCISNTGSTLYIDGFFFDTYISITLYDVSPYNESVLNECMNMCEKYEKIFSRTNTTSELYIINQHISNNPNKAIQISDDMFQCIKNTLRFSASFGKQYSILSGNLCDIWDYEQKIIPNNDDIKQHLASIDAHNINLNDASSSLILAYNQKDNTSEDLDNTHKYIVPNIDLGASAKGYIADKLCSYLKEQGITDAIIDLGGNIVVIGDKPDDSMYKIGIKKPFSDTNEISAICKIADVSLVTSGIYQRYFVENDTIYHHIIDCATGYPTDNDILSVTIISKNALQADCFSTGCLLLGKEDTLSLINSTKEVECVIIDSDYNIHLSDGLTYDKDFIVLK